MPIEIIKDKLLVRDDNDEFVNGLVIPDKTGLDSVNTVMGIESDNYNGIAENLTDILQECNEKLVEKGAEEATSIVNIGNKIESIESGSVIDGITLVFKKGKFNNEFISLITLYGDYIINENGYLQFGGTSHEGITIKGIPSEYTNVLIFLGDYTGNGQLGNGTSQMSLPTVASTGANRGTYLPTSPNKIYTLDCIGNYNNFFMCHYNDVTNLEIKAIYLI